MQESVFQAAECRYKCIDIHRGPRLHFIEPWSAAPNLVMIAVTVNFGGRHLTCIDEYNTVHTFPQGIAHFLEHIIMGHDLWRQLEMRCAVTCNGVVQEDRTIFYVKSSLFNLTSKRSIDIICAILKNVLLILMEYGLSDENFMLKSISELNVIDSESSGLQFELDYLMKMKLRAALYHNNPIRYDFLGTKESRRTIHSGHVRLIRDFIRTNIFSVIILGKSLFVNKFVEKVEDTVKETLAKYPISRTLHLSPPISEPMEANRNIEGLSFSVDSSYLLYGMKLSPLEEIYPASDLFLRMYLLTYLLNHIKIDSVRIGGILTHNTRAYLIRGSIENTRFFWDPLGCREVTKQFQTNLVERLKLFREYSSHDMEWAFIQLLFSQGEIEVFLKLCHAADLFGYQFTDLMNTFKEIRTDDFNNLIVEVLTSQENTALIYTSPHLDEL